MNDRKLIKIMSIDEEDQNEKRKNWLKNSEKISE